jgi:hypothetical protein
LTNLKYANRPDLCLMYITNKPVIAAIAEKYSVNRIFIDLETMGKEERQGQVNSVKSKHQVSDVSAVKHVLGKAQLLVRVNPLYDGTGGEVDAVIERGADLVMLPMYKSLDDVKRFVDLVGGRAKVMLLCETNEAAALVSETAAMDGVDEMFIGLNDLHLARKMQFMFELLADGTVDDLCGKMQAAGIPYGFGGIAQLNLGMLPAHYIIAEHYRLGSQIAILSRSFYDSNCNDDNAFVEHLFAYGVKEIRSYEKEIQKESDAFFVNNHLTVKQRVNQIVNNRLY